MTDIDLQRRADEAATTLRRDGYREQADIITELRAAYYELGAKLRAVREALK